MNTTFDSDSCFLSQDTIVALQALSKYASYSQLHDIDLAIRVNTDASTTVASFRVDQDNYLLLQTRQVLVWQSWFSICC